MIEELQFVEALESAPACSVATWPDNPYRLVSLWDMVTLQAVNLASIWPALHEVHLGYVMGGEDKPTEEELQKSFGLAVSVCSRIGWKDLANHAKRILDRATSGEDGDGMRTLVEDFTQAFGDKTRELFVVVIEQRDTELFLEATKSLCGAALHADLAVSEEELNLAGKALAMGLSTASVSHAMRSAEASLYVFARALGVTFSGALELQDWKVLTDKIRSEIARWEATPRTPQKSEELKRFAELLIPADAFRLAWRNHVAHAREKYEEQEARTILGHVGGFLKKLSDGL